MKTEPTEEEWDQRGDLEGVHSSCGTHNLECMWEKLL